MLLASVIFLSPQWLWPAIAVLAVTLAGVAWSYRTAPPEAPRLVCAVLKLLGVALLALCLLEPAWLGEQARPGANFVAILADNSQSLQVRDRAGGGSRAEALRTLLGPDTGGWQRGLAEKFEVRRFLFDARLSATFDFSDLSSEGRGSAIGGALRALASRFAGRPLAGIVLLSDGIATDLPDGAASLEALPPVYAVPIGEPVPVRDLALAQVRASPTAFEDAPVSVQAEVKASGLAGETAVAQLLDSAGRKLEQTTLRARREQEALSFRFQWRPEKPGVSFYRVRVGLAGEIDGAAARTNTSEATLLNNAQVVAVDRGRGPYRILYVGGRPNWEYKFLNRALQEDDQVQLVALIRVALREPKFEFRGRAGETGNPLFRGFGNQSREEVERYDQPVLARQNTRDELELRGGFPRTPEELYVYDAVVLDDLEAAFFAPDQAMVVQKFVSERGGGLLMLGGAESFQQGGYQRTPIGEMLPVYLDRGGEDRPPGPLKLDLAREGWLQGWARLRETEPEEKTRLHAMPFFQVLNRLPEVKPGASVVATARDEQGRHWPALVTQRFGRGRTAAFALGDVWRWGMRDPEARHDLEKSWRQLTRWLVADVPRPVELVARPAGVESPGGVQLEVRVRDRKYQPLEDASVTLLVERALADSPGAAGRVVRLQPEASLAEPGLYTAAFVAREAGGYRASVQVTNAAGAEVGRAEAGWSTDPAGEEFRSLQPDRGLLEAVARRTGGRVIPATRLESLPRELAGRRAPVMEASTLPLWHTPAALVLALGCLIGEWGLRRWKGLP